MKIIELLDAPVPFNREKLEKDSKDIEKLILQLSQDGCKNDNNELVFLTSRYSYIKELLKKYWKDGEKNE